VRTTLLQIPLAAGRYTIIVDTVSIDAAQAPFTLSAADAPPEENAACATPTALAAAAPAVHDNLALGGPPVAACGGATTTLYYAVEVPSGNLLTVSADASGTDQSWTPQVAAFDACDAMACLARGNVESGPDQQLNWINNGSASHTVILSVSSDGPVVNGEFDITASLTDLLSPVSPPPPI
jgi:hypothetical protein